MNLRKKIVFIIVTIILVVSCGCGSKSDFFWGNNYKISNPKTYTDQRFKFSVNYPDKWEIVIEKYHEATLTQEATPESGIDIFVNGNTNNKIRIYGGFSHIDPLILLDGTAEDSFINDEKIEGKISHVSSNGRTIAYLALGDGFIGAYINVSNKCISKNRKQILGILKSIKIKGSINES